MGIRNCFIVTVFLVSILALSGVLWGQRVIDLNKVWGDMRILGDGNGEKSGCAVASRDVNNDEYDDMIIGAFCADPPGGEDAGETNLILGGGAFITAHGLGGKSWVKEFSLLANGLNSFKAFGGVNAQGEVHLGKSNY